ncbi:hypothetical protein KFL_003080010 [Klebsormidium nitens]|uniref:Uncharacterized protein n=1 Tax=Klebsormidium nitens TaxID=105231 RepID=A0A1Y1I711_KLENI|nr:hypothetical protein KFL_003080010 [Klebsormidium nitens]|eukprot:GAQ86730.1 hypothetical protein KFL_003080010 [Klebsormidium nitens]
MSFLEVLKPLAVGVDHVTRRHVELFVNEFIEQITEAAEKSFCPSGRFTGARDWLRDSVWEVSFDECVLGQLLRGLASLGNETHLAVLDLLLKLGLFDLEELFKKTLAKFGRKCAVSCGMAEDSEEAEWFVSKLGPSVGELNQEDRDWIPPVFMKRLLTRYVEAPAQKPSCYTIRGLEQYLYAWKGISVCDFGEFCEALTALRSTPRTHTDRLFAALCLLNAEQIVAEPGAVDAIMQHVQLQRVTSTWYLRRAAECAALKPDFQKKIRERNKYLENNLRRQNEEYAKRFGGENKSSRV